MTATHDPVNHPKHYNSHPSGIECIAVVQHMGFCLGNAIKYIWRADEKGNAIEDLEKARWYLDREIARRRSQVAHKQPAAPAEPERLVPRDLTRAPEFGKFATGCVHSAYGVKVVGGVRTCAGCGATLSSSDDCGSDPSA